VTFHIRTYQSINDATESQSPIESDLLSETKVNINTQTPECLLWFSNAPDAQID